MGWHAPQMHLKPDHPKLRTGQHFIERFRDKRRVRPIAPLQAGQRPVSGAFLFDHRLKKHVPRRCQPAITQRIQRKQVRRDPRLHVPRAAPIHPAIVDARLERRRIPHVERPLGHHIHMPVQDQRGTTRTGPPGPHHVHRVLVIADHRRKARHVADILDLHLPAVDLIAARIQLARDEILCALLIAPRRRVRGQLRQKRDLLVKKRIHRFHDPGLVARFHLCLTRVALPRQVTASRAPTQAPRQGPGPPVARTPPASRRNAQDQRLPLARRYGITRPMTDQRGPT